MPGDAQRGLEIAQRLAELTLSMVNFAEPANGRKIFRRVLKHVLQLGLRFVEVVQLEERTPERDARGQITRMGREAAAAGGHRLFKAARAPVFFGELRKRDRRRVFFDPASKLFYAWVICHRRSGYCTLIC